MFRGFNISVIGASHHDKGIVCQDSSAHLCTEVYAIAVVSDGHGSKKHFRSDVGSRIATEVSIAAMSEFFQRKNEYIDRLDDDYHMILRQLESNLIYRWRHCVRSHFDDNPLSAAEKLIYQESYGELDKMERVYGAPLVIGALTPSFALGIQIGDGACVLINDEHEVIFPIPADDRLAFGITTSLCESNAINDFRHFYCDKLPSTIIVSTDGVTDSYAEESFTAFNKKIAQLFREDHDSALRELSDWLPHLSEEGSRDDMSMSSVYIAQKGDKN